MAGTIVRLHRVLRAPAERIYRTFGTPDATAKWLALEMCYLGWQESHELLARLVEPEIPA